MTSAPVAPNTVRAASVLDLPRLLPLAEEFYRESKMLKGFEADRFINLWSALLSNGTGVIFLLERDGVIVGTISGVAYPEQYSSRLVAQEFFLFINKECRGGFGLLRLLRTFERWAKDEGCAQLRIGHLMDSMPAELGRLYKRLGFEHIESAYAKELI